VVTSYEPPHHITPSPSTKISNSAHEIELKQLGFGILAVNSLPASYLRTRRPATVVTSYEPHYHIPPLPSTKISNGAHEIELKQLGFRISAL
jgi:hypothetical protein